MRGFESSLLRVTLKVDSSETEVFHNSRYNFKLLQKFTCLISDQEFRGSWSQEAQQEGRGAADSASAAGMFNYFLLKRQYSSPDFI